MNKRYVIVQNSIRTTFLFRKAYIKMLLNEGDVCVIAPNDDEFSYQELIKMGVYIYDIPPFDSISNKIKAILKMNFYIITERFKKSTIISHFLISFILCYFSLVPFNRKLIIYTEGLGSLFTKNYFLRLLLRTLLSNSKAIRLFCNESERNLIGKRNDIVTNGIGIDLNKFKVNYKYSDVETYNLLYVGRLIKDKGVEDAIYVFRELRLKYKIRMTLVGDIYPNNPSSLSVDDINSYKEEFGTSITFVKFTHEIILEYAKANILIIPSVREGFPVCVMEANAMGLPAVGYEVAGVKDAINKNVNGDLAQFGSLASLVEVTEAMLSNDVLKTFFDSSIVYAKDNFNQEEKSKFIVDLIKGL